MTLAQQYQKYFRIGIYSDDDGNTVLVKPRIGEMKVVTPTTWTELFDMCKDFVGDSTKLKETQSEEGIEREANA